MWVKARRARYQFMANHGNNNHRRCHLFIRSFLTVLEQLCPKHHIRWDTSYMAWCSRWPRKGGPEEPWSGGSGGNEMKQERSRNRNYRLAFFGSFKHPLHQPLPDLLSLPSAALTYAQRRTFARLRTLFHIERSLIYILICIFVNIKYQIRNIVIHAKLLFAQHSNNAQNITRFFVMSSLSREVFPNRFYLQIGRWKIKGYRLR